MFASLYSEFSGYSFFLELIGQEPPQRASLAPGERASPPVELDSVSDTE